MSRPKLTSERIFSVLEKIRLLGLYDGVIRDAELIAAREHVSAEEALFMTGLPERYLLKIIATAFELPYISSTKLRHGKIPQDVLNLIPSKTAVELNVLPLRQSQQTLYVAVARVDDAKLLESVKILSGFPEIRPVLAWSLALRCALRQFYEDHGDPWLELDAPASHLTTNIGDDSQYEPPSFPLDINSQSPESIEDEPATLRPIKATKAETPAELAKLNLAELPGARDEHKTYSFLPHHSEGTPALGTSTRPSAGSHQIFSKLDSNSPQSNGRHANSVQLVDSLRGHLAVNQTKINEGISLRPPGEPVTRTEPAPGLHSRQAASWFTQNQVAPRGVMEVLVDHIDQLRGLAEHSRRTYATCFRIADRLEIPDIWREALRRAVWLHDVGVGAGEHLTSMTILTGGKDMAERVRNFVRNRRRALSGTDLGASVHQILELSIDPSAADHAQHQSDSAGCFFNVHPEELLLAKRCAQILSISDAYDNLVRTRGRSGSQHELRQLVPFFVSEEVFSAFLDSVGNSK